jgi:hypothetical protein
MVFLIHSPETFSAIEPVVNLLTARPEQFELLFCAIPRNYTGVETTDFEGLENTFEFLKGKGLEPLALRGDSGADLQFLVRLAPDYIFRQSPWDWDIPQIFAASRLRFARLCYIPYGLMTVDEPECQYNQPFHNACDMIFCESDFHLQAYANHRSKGSAGVYATGYPRFQSLLAALRTTDPIDAWPIATAGILPRIIWAPHHSVSQDWLGFSTFMDYKELMLQEARRGRCSILFRPHPALLPRLKASGLMTEEDYKGYLRSFDATPASRVDINAEYAQSFAASELLITDGIGFFSEYLLTGKPLVRTIRDSSTQLNQFGQWMVEAFRNVANAGELQAVFEEVAERRYLDAEAALRQERQARLLTLSDGAAERIVEHLEVM